MNIEGLGPAIVDQLLDLGYVTEAADLFKLTAEQLLTLDGFADRSAAKLVEFDRRAQAGPARAFHQRSRHPPRR